MNPWELASLAAHLLGEECRDKEVSVVAIQQDEEECIFTLRVRAREPRMLIEGAQAPAGSVPQA